MELYNEQDLLIRRGILEHIIRDAQLAGDMRWERVASEQLEPINRALSKVRGLPPVVIQAQAGVMGVKTERGIQP